MNLGRYNEGYAPRFDLHFVIVEDSNGMIIWYIIWYDGNLDNAVGDVVRLVPHKLGAILHDVESDDL